MEKVAKNGRKVNRRPANILKCTLRWHFLLQAVNWYFLIAYTLANKSVYVGTSDFGFIVENFRILKFCLMYYVD